MTCLAPWRPAGYLAGMDFYDSVAETYDDMTGFEARVAGARAFVAKVLEQRAMGSVIDVACGTGLYAMAFAQAGVPVVAGVDISAGMLGAARRRAGNLGLNVRWLPARMEKLGGAGLAPADGIVCLGNSIPHLLTERALQSALRAFHKLLSTNGLLALQLLNYERVMKRAERIVEINRAGDCEFVRFYDLPSRPGGKLVFNVLRIEWTADEPRHTLDATVLKPYTVCGLRKSLENCGFRNVQVYGGVRFQAYDAEESETVLLTAVR